MSGYTKQYEWATHHCLFNFIINGNDIGSRGTVKQRSKKVTLETISESHSHVYVEQSVLVFFVLVEMQF